MRKFLLLLPLAACLLLSGQVRAQNDIFDGLFEKEEPVFHPEVLPTEKDGEVQVVLYFTHSKMSELEVSLWVKDQGTRLRGDGRKDLAGGLRVIGNRQPDTLLIRDLAESHFYSIGIDYRNPKALSRKFASRVLQEGYRYSGAREAAAPPVAASPAPPALQERTAWSSPPPPDPCMAPDLNVRVAASGYCGPANRPAVLIECLNCPERWDFAVETRTENGRWTPLRADGGRHMADGATLRTEPLCTLQPDVYYIRVLAWGKNCSTPVIHTAGPIVVMEPSRSGLEPDLTVKSPQPMGSPAIQLPEDCRVEGEATITADLISGTVELASNSPCAALNPYAQVTYVNPGYRDITLNRFPLTPGAQAPFDIRLDDRDLQRGIHTIQVVVFAREDGMTEGVPINSFWIRAEEEAFAETAYNVPPQRFDPQTDRTAFGTSAPGRPQAAIKGFDTEEPYESSLSEGLDTVQVSASDPNCTQIKDLQLVFDPNRPNQPLYISWLSPRCCQEEGCSYSVWAGKNPDELRILVRGKKPGAVVRELLEGQQASDQYFEVVVNTTNGARKAAYVVGEGPKYGFEEIITYRDRNNPPLSDTLTFAQLSPYTYQQPSRPLSDFGPCKYRRDILVTPAGEIEEGDSFTLAYDFSDPGYQYTLYFQPLGSAEWVLAPDTRERQERPSFTMNATPFHTGKYLILAAKKKWGCLSAPPAEGKVVSIKTEGEVAR